MSFSLNFVIDADIERRVMSSKIYGVWKRETALHYHNDYIEEAAPLIGQKWAKIVNLSNWKPSYPEINKILGEHMRWSKENGNTLAIYVIDNPVTRSQLKKMFSAGDTGTISKIVKTREDAEKILIEHGF
jgi:hypothetical protein